MPLYEYVCRACAADFEALLPASRRDGGDAACPRCGATKTARKISLTARPVVKDGGGASAPFDCGAPGGCCGGACGPGD